MLKILVSLVILKFKKKKPFLQGLDVSRLFWNRFLFGQLLGFVVL